MLSEEFKKRHPRLYAFITKVEIPCFYCQEESQHLKYEYTDEWIALPVCVAHFTNDKSAVYIQNMCRILNEALDRAPELRGKVRPIAK